MIRWTDSLIDRVGDILHEAADTAVLPRFRRLQQGEVIEKAPDELVTVADRDAEALITPRLLDVLPGSRVVGEEACAADAASAASSSSRCSGARCPGTMCQARCC